MCCWGRGWSRRSSTAGIESEWPDGGRQSEITPAATTLTRKSRQPTVANNTGAYWRKLGRRAPMCPLRRNTNRGQAVAIDRSPRGAGRQIAGKTPPSPFSVRDSHRFHVTDQIFRTLRTVVRGAYGIGWAYIALLMVQSLSGQTTSLLVEILLEAFVNLRFIGVAAVIAALAGWGYRERQIRKRQTDRWHRRMRELEQLIDRNRSTSTLTPRGDTNPSDRDL
jgi:hypothetical protein